MKVKSAFWQWHNPIAWGLALTISLAVLVTFLAFQNGPAGSARYSEFGGLPSNAVGDTLAGIFAPLAFIWIVVTVFLQSHELREQRNELTLTREELKLAREAQQKQLEVMQVQADIFEDERTYRLHESSKKTLDQLLVTIATKSRKENDLIENFIVKAKYDGEYNTPTPFLCVSGKNSEEIVMSIGDSLEAFRERIDPNQDQKFLVLTRKSANQNFYLRIRDDFDYLISLFDRLAEDQQIRLQFLEVRKSQAILDWMLDANIWLPEGNIS
jgi:hypothetical protein